MSATEVFRARPRLAAVVAILAVVAGVSCAGLLSVALFPSLARPAISVSCSYPGANAVEVINTVAGPLEEKINGVEGMDRMTSSCQDNGAYSLTVSFAVGYDRDVALMKVQSKVQQALSLLPQEVKNTGVTVQSGTTEELGILTLRSPGGTLSLDEVSECVYSVVDPAILRLAGVGKTAVRYDKNAVRVWMKPERLAALGLNTDDVVAAIKAQNVQASLGTVGASPSDDKTARVMTLVSKGRLSSPAEFGEIIVHTSSDGGILRLRDVAEVGMGPQGYAYSALYGETPAVYIVIYLLPGANPLETMDQVKAELAKLEPYLPSDLAWDMTYDATVYMRRVLRTTGLCVALALAFVFAGLWIYLRAFRAALVVVLSLAIPVSLSAVVLYAGGCQVSLPALYALLASLVLSAGMAARSFDDVRRGRLPGAGHVAAALVVASAATPLAFVDGVQGALFRPMSVVLAAMAVFSAFNSLLLVPVAATPFRAADVSDGEPPADGRRGFPLPVFLLAVLALVVSAALYAKLPKAFVPEEDMGVMYVDCKLAEGTPLAKTRETMRRISREVSALEGVGTCATLLGESIVNGSGENNAKILVALDDWGARGADKSEYELSRRIQGIVDGIAEVESYVIRLPPIKGIGSQSGVTVLFQAIGDNDPVKFSREVLRMREELAKSPLAQSVAGGFYTDAPHLRVVVDRAKCELLQVPMVSVFSVLQHCLGSVYVNDVNIGTQVNRVTAMAEWRGRARPEDVTSLYVRARTGAMVPLGSLVTCHEELGPRSCYRCNQFLYCTEQFVPKAGVSESEAIAEIRRICADKLSPGFVNDWGGATYESQKSRGGDGLLIALSILVAYFVLVAYRESWRGAFFALLPSAAAVFGAVAALACTGNPFSVYSRYALVVLVAETAALSLLAPPTARFRARAFFPFLAALTFLPLMFVSGAGAAGSRSLGTTFFGGFFASALLGTFLTLLIRQEKRSQVSPSG